MANTAAAIAALKAQQDDHDPEPADAQTPVEPAEGEDAQVPAEPENAQEAPGGPESGPSEPIQPVKVPEAPGINAAQAEKQAQALREASRRSPVRQLRFMLAKLAREWEYAAGELEGASDELSIELVGSLSMGMRVPCSNKNGAPDTGVVVRVMSRDGQTSIHLEPEGSPMPVYLNYAGPTSPVAVYR